ELTEMHYSDIIDLDVDPLERTPAEKTQITETGWIGFTDQYWMATLVAPENTSATSVVKYTAANDTYQTELRYDVIEVAPGAVAETTSRLFAGAKEWDTIRDYQNALGINQFVDAIDWGWFAFLTKPIFIALHYLNVWIGNMGWAILALTLGIKTILFPLAYKSYVSMSRMKMLQPEMEKIKEAAGDDRQKLQQEMMALYKKEKVNPASGCLPILVQIPIFFSLYKVIFVTIELRHAPWIAWIEDLSAPDPTSFMNLFGLLPFSPPGPESLFAIFSIGVLPILMGVTMWMQQKLNPAPPDKTQ
ncbi:MAG: membrane protein insertase YidC, partial [Pseudomonadota bacterium]